MFYNKPIEEKHFSEVKFEVQILRIFSYGASYMYFKV